MIECLIPVLKFEEGFRSAVYLDSEGYPSIGYGYLLSKEKMTIEQARRYYPFVWTAEAAESMMLIRVKQIQERIKAYPAIIDAYENCNGARRGVLISMAYQMGCRNLSKFKKTLSHLDKRNYFAASVECLDSKWARQVPNRAHRHAKVIRCGDLSVYEGLL